MSLAEYKLYKDTGVTPWYKAKTVREFWETNPTYAQENLRSCQVQITYLTGLFLGVIIGGLFVSLMVVI